MRVHNLFYREEGDIKRFVEERGIEDSDGLLIQVFTGITDPKFIRGIQRELRDIFERAAVIGTTTGGEIYNGQVTERSTVLSFTLFEKAKVKCTCSASEDSYRAGEDIAKSLKDGNLKLIILFADGLFSNGDALIDAFNGELSEVPVAGGLAGDNFTFTGTYVFTADELLLQGGVGAAVYTDELYITGHYNLAWIPIGKEMEVTKAEGNRIYEIEGKPVIDVYREYLGSTADELLPHIAIEFPLVFERDGILFARACLGPGDDGSMIYEGAIREGEKVRFSIWDTGVMLDSVAENLRKFRCRPSEAIFVYTCLGRKYLMGSEAEIESKYLQNIAPTSGFLTYGEFFRHGGKNRFMNYTFTAISLSERNEIRGNVEEDLREEPDREMIRFRALVSLVNSITKELQEANEKLEKLAEKDPLTGLYNRRKMMEILRSEVSKANRYGSTFCLLMIDIDNFKLINDSYGHAEGDRVLSEMADLMRELLRETDTVARWGGEEFLILLPKSGTGNGSKVARKIKDAVRNRFSKQFKEGVSVSIGVSSFKKGEDIDETIKRADFAMYTAKRRGKNQVVAY